MFRKAQAAMEFLMTYGWALLAVLVVIGALAYLGILDVETILPERCTFPVPLNCQDHVINNDNIKLVLLNGAGRGMDIRSIIAESEAFAAEGAADANYKCAWTPVSSGEAAHLGSHLLRNGQSKTFTLRWSIPQDTKFSLSSNLLSLNSGVYHTGTAPGDLEVTDPDDTTAAPVRSATIIDPVTTTIVATPAVPGSCSSGTYSVGPPELCTGGTNPSLTNAVAAVAAVYPSNNRITFEPIATGETCYYKDVGRGKNRYAITVYYTWSDSRSILHKVGGELFSAAPE